MDLLLSVMSSGTCFTRSHLYRYYRLKDHMQKEGHEFFTSLHSTGYPQCQGIKDMVAKHARVIVPVRDPILSLYTGRCKENPDHHQYQRIRGFRGILEVWDDSKFYPAPVDMQDLEKRDAYWRAIFGDMPIDWGDIVNHSKAPQGSVWETLREQYISAPLSLGKTPYKKFGPKVAEEFELARDEIQKFMEGLGYQPLTWWR